MDPTTKLVTYTIDQAGIERLIAAASLAAAKEVKAEGPSKTDMEAIAEEALARFMDRLGIDDIPALRKDLTAMRAARETKEALISHGLKAVLTLLIGGIITAIWLALKDTRG
jgi:hypothetical protein